MNQWMVENRNFLLRLLGTLLSLGLLFFLAKDVQGDFSEVMRSADPVFLLGGLLLIFPARIFVAARWHVLLRSGGIPIPFRRTVELTFTGLFASNFLPTTIGGDLARLAGGIKLGYDRAMCVASLIVDRLIGMAGMLMVAPLGISLIYVPKSGVGALLAVWQRVSRFAQRIMRAMSMWLRKPWVLVLSLAMTWANMLFLFAGFYALARGLGVELPYWTLVGLYSLAYFVTLVPVSINGYGVQELSLTYLFSHFGGMTVSQSLTFAVLVRLAFIFTSLPGALFIPTLIAGARLQDEQDLL
jgi:hypothetical protein